MFMQMLARKVARTDRNPARWRRVPSSWQSQFADLRDYAGVAWYWRGWTQKYLASEARILLHFGAVCLRRDLGPDALSAIERAHHLQPANNSALYLLARAHIALQNWQEAYDLFCEFTKRVPDYAPAYYAPPSSG